LGEDYAGNDLPDSTTAKKGRPQSRFGLTIVMSMMTGIVRRIEIGQPVRALGDAAGISQGTAPKWLTRYRAEGRPGLRDRSMRARRSNR
jgi:hypothetical protein